MVIIKGKIFIKKVARVTHPLANWVTFIKHLAFLHFMTINDTLKNSHFNSEL